MRIFDFRWDDETKKPYFEILKDGELQKKFLTIGKNFSLTCTNDEPVCVGRIEKKEYISCPDNAVGKKKCELCKKAEDYFPCQFCNGFNCGKFREKKIENCDADHMVYLALFSKDVIKVGVSRFSRGKARQFEQGAHFTRVFAVGMSGVMARRIESVLGRAGFPDKIPATKKKSILLPNISREEGEKILEEKFLFAKENLIGQMPEMAKYIVENEFWNMLPYYSQTFEALEKTSLPVHIEKISKDESIGGKLEAVKGSFLLINTGTEIAAVLAKDFVGKQISFDDCPLGITKQGGFQGMMF